MRIEDISSKLIWLLENRPEVLGLAFLILLVLSKIYLKYWQNKKLHDRPNLIHKFCPFCETLNPTGSSSCEECNKELGNNLKGVACLNCGHLGEMKTYNGFLEFWVTWFLCVVSPIPFLGLGYFFSMQNQKICKSCGRMTRGADYAVKSAT